MPNKYLMNVASEFFPDNGGHLAVRGNKRYLVVIIQVGPKSLNALHSLKNFFKMFIYF